MSNISKKELDNLYWTKRLTIRQIAKLKHVSCGTINPLLKRYHLRPKDKGVAGRTAIRSYFQEQDFTPTQQLNELVDGLMLGDGGLSPKGKLTLQQCRKFKTWVKHIGIELKKNGVNYTISNIKNTNIAILGIRTKSRMDAVMLQTHLYKYFKEQYQRWYPNGVKTIPQDVILTPYSLALFYMGDGSMGQSKLRIYTDNFQLKEQESLLSKLNATFHLSFRIEHRLTKYILALGRQEQMNQFVSIVRPHILPVFQYKLKVR